ncbi:hypothetical protein CSHISOI_11823, partial [Colletotrichum shisoi]
GQSYQGPPEQARTTGDWLETTELLTLSPVRIRPRRRAGLLLQGPTTTGSWVTGAARRRLRASANTGTDSQDVYPKGDAETEAVASDDNRMPNRRMEAIGSVLCLYFGFFLYVSVPRRVLACRVLACPVLYCSACRVTSLHFTAHTGRILIAKLARKTLSGLCV